MAIAAPDLWTVLQEVFGQLSHNGSRHCRMRLGDRGWTNGDGG